VATPAEAGATIRQLPARSAILFGPERSGLDAEDVALARTIVTVPINPEFSSLNLAQAVILIAYEWSKGERLAMPTRTEDERPAPQAELEGMIDHFETALEPTGYFFPPDRAPTTKRALRTILTKPGWTTPEIRTLRGVVSALQKKRRD
jgi:tRNA/rRNA methyltransferase